jgi:pimeloyl-ACP methyl ester carboxylesterase
MEHNHAVTDHFWWARGYEWIGAALWPYDRRGVYRSPFRHAEGAQTPLVFGGTRDPATPYKWAKRYVRDLGNARLLTYRADGHVALTDLNACVGFIVIRYIEAGALPPEGATCRQEVPEPGAAALRTGPSLEAWRRTAR